MSSWAAQSAANEKVGQFSESQILMYIFESARTYFREKTENFNRSARPPRRRLGCFGGLKTDKI
jgi:hypothetical protein